MAEKRRQPLQVPILQKVAQKLPGFWRMYIDGRTRSPTLLTPSGTRFPLPAIARAALAAGDLLVWCGDCWRRLPIGADDEVLTADSTKPAGLAWAASGGGGGSALDPFNRLWLVEDWIKRTTEDGEWGQLGWSTTALNAGTQAYIAVSTGTGWRDSGVIRLGGGSSGASATAPRGRVHYLGESNASGITPLYGRPGAGVYFAVKVSITSATLNNQTVWTGVWEKSTTWPDPAGVQSNSGIGVRASDPSAAGLGNWYGVVRNGTTETTVDLGVAADSTWRTIGWRATSTGIQFIIRTSGAWVDTGTEVAWGDSGMPSTSTVLAPTIAAVGHALAARTADFDLFALWGEDLERGA